MTLSDAVSHLASFDDQDTIYAAEPWSAASAVAVATEPAEGGLPVEAQRLGLTYFLEVFVAREFLEDWTLNLDAEPPLQDKVRRLIQYAVKDA